MVDKIKAYEFFSYRLTEALYLSDKERAMMIGIFNTIENELQGSIDNFSQNIMISQLEQLQQSFLQSAIHYPKTCE